MSFLEPVTKKHTLYIKHMRYKGTEALKNMGTSEHRYKEHK